MRDGPSRPNGYRIEGDSETVRQQLDLIRRNVQDQIVQRASDAADNEAEPPNSSTESACEGAVEQPIPPDTASVLPEPTEAENVEKIIMWREQRTRVQKQHAYLPTAKRLIGRFPEDGGITQYDYDQLKLECERSFARYVRLRASVEHLDPKNKERWAVAYAT
jgi:hypothetical protein